MPDCVLQYTHTIGLEGTVLILISVFFSMR
jgi:hypothetical protein